MPLSLNLVCTHLAEMKGLKLKKLSLKSFDSLECSSCDQDNLNMDVENLFFQSQTQTLKNLMIDLMTSTSRTVSALLRTIAGLSNLTTLQLKVEYLNNEDPKALFKAFPKFESLHTLILQDTSDLFESKYIASLMKSLSQIPTLRILGLEMHFKSDSKWTDDKVIEVVSSIVSDSFRHLVHLAFSDSLYMDGRLNSLQLNQIFHNHLSAYPFRKYMTTKYM